MTGGGAHRAPAVTVLGVGNPIMGDDGVGLELLAAVQARWTDQRVEFVDGGTGGMELLPIVQDARRLLILDAVAGPTPGQVVELTGNQIPRLLSSKLSPHQVGLLDVFAAARLLGREPDTIAVVGVVPESVELGLGLSPVVAAALSAAAAQANARLADWLDQEARRAAPAGQEGPRRHSNMPPPRPRRLWPPPGPLGHVQFSVGDLELAAGHQLGGRGAADRAGQGEELVNRLGLLALGAPHSGHHRLDQQPRIPQHGIGDGHRPGASQGLGVGPAAGAHLQPDRLHPARPGRDGRLFDSRDHPAQQSQLVHHRLLPPADHQIRASA
jgi:hydrogenase maturation protease